MEFAVIKIIDGILLSSPALLHDQQFLINNKISHTIGYLESNFYINTSQLEYLGIKSLILTKSAKQQQEVQESLTIQDIESSIKMIIQCRQECLCCLLYANDIFDCLPLVAAYLLCRYGWMFKVSLAFLTRRLDQLGIGGYQNTVENANQFMPRLLLKIFPYNTDKLKYLEWNMEFLKMYQTDDVQQLMLINTVKNSINLADKPRFSNLFEDNVGLTKKKKRRIQWFDEVAKNSITAGQRLFANSKINSSFKKNSNLKINQPKTSIKLGKNDQIISLIASMNKQEGKSVKKLGISMKQNQFEDFEYLSLKQMSRTNFNDIKFKNSMGLHKRKSLKVFNKKDNRSIQKISKKQRQNLSLVKSAQKFYENSSTSPLNFIKGLKTLDLQHHS